MPSLQYSLPSSKSKCFITSFFEPTNDIIDIVASVGREIMQKSGTCFTGMGASDPIVVISFEKRHFSIVERRPKRFRNANGRKHRITRESQFNIKRNLFVTNPKPDVVGICTVYPEPIIFELWLSSTNPFGDCFIFLQPVKNFNKATVEQRKSFPRFNQVGHRLKFHQHCKVTMREKFRELRKDNRHFFSLGELQQRSYV